MSDKYYRVKKDTFLWKEGAVLKFDDKLSQGGYRAIEDIWDACPSLGTEYITARIIEDPDNAEWFERVYTNNVTGLVYRTKDQLKEMYERAFK